MNTKKITVIVAVAILAILIGTLYLPINEAQAVSPQEPVVIEPVDITLTKADVTVKQFDKVDPLDYVVTGTFDAIDYSIVDTSETGPQLISYTATKGNESIKRHLIIQVLDTQGPTIEGDDTITLKYESDYAIETDYVAVDTVDGNVDVTLIQDVDRSVPGEYEAILTAQDSSGNKTTKTITVIVLEDPEVIALQERNEEYASLVDSANIVVNTLLADTSVDEVSSMFNQVSNALDYESDYTSQLSDLYNELNAKLDRVEDYYTPQPVVVQQAPAVVETEAVETEAVETEPVVYDSTLGQQAVNIAMQYVGYNYSWGGTSPSTGFDCSGLTTFVYAQLGINLPRTASGQLYSGYSVSSPAVGDLVIYPGAGHVAIYIGNGQVVHALDYSYGVLVTSMHYSGTPIAYRRVV